MPETFIEDDWISATIGVKSYRYEPCGNIASAGLEKAMLEVSAGSDAFFYAKVPTDQLSQASRLTQAGFSLVDTNVVFERQRNVSPDCLELPDDIEVIDARPEHHSQLQGIAGSCFRYSRFHQDPLFPEDIANHVKRKWIENYCLGKRGAVLYAALLAGSPVGFLAVLTPPGQIPVAVIDLIGVEAAYQRRGIGRALVSCFIDRWQNRVEQLVVGTQITNRSSMALYADFGFRVVNSAYVLHAHMRKKGS